MSTTRKKEQSVFATGDVFTPEIEIATVREGQPHVVILGAGASKAAFPQGDADGRLLPVMNDLLEIAGLCPILTKHAITNPPANFEELYTTLAASDAFSKCRQELEVRVREYFSQLRLPENPTIYDHLVLSLRPRDVIATFNWDPLLVLAARRNSKAVDLPRLLFLHGNVAVGFCAKDKRFGCVNARCPVCAKLYEATPLLYPVAKKNYTSNPFIKAQWQDLRDDLKKACRLTIFGYGAPKTDIEAVRLMKRAWGTRAKRNIEQIELIDLQSEQNLMKNWSGFIFSHHYSVMADFYHSSIARHPRRTSEAYAATHIFGMFEDGHPLPKDASFPELRSWFVPLTKAERTAYGVAASREGHSNSYENT